MKSATKKDQYNNLRRICKKRMFNSFLIFINCMLIMIILLLDMEPTQTLTLLGWIGVLTVSGIYILCIIQFFSDLASFETLKSMKDQGIVMVEIKGPDDLLNYRDDSEFGIFKSTILDSLKNKQPIKKYSLKKVTQKGVYFSWIPGIVEYPFHMYYVSEEFKEKQNREHREWEKARKATK